MIILYHKNNAVTQVWDDLNSKEIAVKSVSIAKSLFEIANRFPQSLILWCHESQRDNLNKEKISEIFHHKMIMASYNPSDISYFSSSIGYIEESPFIKINKKVQYPTWQMSTCIGGIHAEVLNLIDSRSNIDFEYFLNSIAKRYMPLGLFCYSNPALLIDEERKFISPKATIYNLFRFVKEHFKSRWSILLFINLLLYDKRLSVFALLYSCFFKNKMNTTVNLEKIIIQSSIKTISQDTIDVIIPTIGRKKYLYDVLKDLAEQTILPQNVIIVEQNTLPKSVTELDYLMDENWPFKIIHIFTHQAGVCNARNVALKEVKSEWVFLNDDDNRFSSKLIENVLSSIKQYGVTALTSSYILSSEKKQYKTISQSGIFGSGNSFIKSSLLSVVSFDKGFEFGYGEDKDFGFQLRNSGNDIIYFPELEIMHLKAPFGGFRIKPIYGWSDDQIQPKPSPSIMLLKLKNLTSQQLLGYKLILFLKLHRLNLLAIPKYNEKWKRSVYWANYLRNN